MKRLTDGEYKKRLSQRNPWVEPLGKYINSSTKMLFRCKMCGKEWEAKPAQVMNGTKCRSCAIKINADAQKKSNAVFLENLALTNPTIVPLEKYAGNRAKILVRCIKCNFTWRVTPGNLLSGKGCRMCAYARNAEIRRKNPQAFIEELKEKNPLVVAIEKYKGASHKIDFRCEVCDYVWKAKPSHILAGHGCPVCGGSQRKRQDQFISELKTINPYIDIIGQYSNARTKILCKCRFCNGEWYAMPDKLLQGTGCPHCDKRNKTSFPEQAIYYYTKQLFPDALNRFRGENKCIELDVYIPSLRIGIEYDGVYYHRNTKRDIEKYGVCRAKGITLIRIIESTALINEDIADKLIRRKKPYRYDTLNECIAELLQELGHHSVVDTFSDAIFIREQYYSILRRKSLQSKYPTIAAEWLFSENGSVTPDMVSYASNDKYWWKCGTCQNEWFAAIADRTTGGKGCPKCGRVSTTNKLMKSHERFVEELKKINPNIRPLEQYQRTHTNIMFHCDRCGNEWSAAPANVLRGRDCPICSRKRGVEKMKETKRKGK